jgi:hypothetical protein
MNIFRFEYILIKNNKKLKIINFILIINKMIKKNKLKYFVLFNNNIFLYFKYMIKI